MQRLKKRKVDHACVYCRRSHMTCDDQRPCGRCIKRSIGHLCHDEPRKRPEDEHAPSSTAAPGTSPSSQSQAPKAKPTDGPPFGDAASTLTVPDPRATSDTVLFNEQVGSEFNSLNEFLTLMDEDLFTQPDLAEQLGLGSDMLGMGMGMGPQPQTGFGTLSKYPSSASLSRLPSQTSLSGQTAVGDLEGTVSATEKFMLTAADPNETSAAGRLREFMDAKVRAGLLKPYNYAQGYERLRKYIDNYMNSSSRQRILQPLSMIRPAFRSVAKSLNDLDLVLVEESFERLLLDYDRIFSSVAMPACLWRRTGEIYRGNKEFAELVECKVEELRDGQLAIYELMSEEAAVNYWEKYGSIAFNTDQKAVVTSCNLRTRDGRKRRQCCFSFTIRRDRYNIPICIVGNFIPIQKGL